MPLLLIDDRDGRIVSEIETEDQAQQILRAWLREDGTVPEYFCLVEVSSHHGTVFGTDSAVKVRPLLTD